MPVERAPEGTALSTPTSPVAPAADRLWTVPNALSVLRLLGVPLFLWLLLGPHADAWALVVLAVSGFTDWLPRGPPPRLHPDGPPRRAPRPGRRPPLHPRHPGRPGAARHDPLVVGDRHRRPGR